MTIKRYVKRDDVVNFPNTTAKIGGFFRLQVKNGETGNITQDTGWFQNVITDYGMDLFGVGTPTGVGFGPIPWSCCVGTGTATPAFSDTTLQSPLVISSPASPTSASYVAGPPAYNFSTIAWAYPLGSVIGNISEVGAGTFIVNPFILANFRCFSRQLILDSMGNPTTIAVTSSDQLNVSYQLRLYFDLTDSTTSINISGTTYGGTIRRALTGLSRAGVMGITTDTPGWGFTTCSICLGSLGTTSSSPGGYHLPYDTATFGTYTPGSFTNTVILHWNTSIANYAIISGFFGCDCLGYWQFELLPGFAKTSSNTLAINFSFAWARY